MIKERQDLTRQPAGRHRRMHGQIPKLICMMISIVMLLSVGMAQELNLCSLLSNQGWTYIASGNSYPEEQIFSLAQDPIEGCLLHQDSMDVGFTDSGGSNGYQLFNVVDPAKPFILKMRARVPEEEQMPSSDNHCGLLLGVYTGTEAFVIGVGPDTIMAIDGSILSNDINNRVFHNYRLEGTPGVGYRLYVDNVLVASGSIWAYNDPADGNSLFIGDGTGRTNAIADIAGFEYIQGAFKLNICSLPSSQGWTYVSPWNTRSEADAFSIRDSGQGCYLYQNTLGIGFQNQDSNAYIRYDMVDPTKPFEIKIRAKILQEQMASGSGYVNHYGFCFGAGTGTEDIGIGIGTDTIMATEGEYAHRILATGQNNGIFHDYRLDVSPVTGYSLYVDGDLLASGSPRIGEGQNRIYFGDATGGSNAEAEIESFEFTQSDSNPNLPPYAPSTPSGPTSGGIGISYDYSALAVDPNGDKVRYTFDWGEGSYSETSYVNSGDTGTASHSWSNSGTYNIKAKATDSNNADSGWSESLAVNIAKSDLIVQNIDIGRPSLDNGIIQITFSSVIGNLGGQDRDVPVEFYCDGIKMGDPFIIPVIDTGQGIPYAVVWNAAKGSHVFKVKARSAEREITTSIDFNFIPNVPIYNQNAIEGRINCQGQCGPVASAMLINYWFNLVHPLIAPELVLPGGQDLLVRNLIVEELSKCGAGPTNGASIFGVLVGLYNRGNRDPVSLFNVMWLPAANLMPWEMAKLQILLQEPFIGYSDIGQRHFAVISGFVQEGSNKYYIYPRQDGIMDVMERDRMLNYILWQTIVPSGFENYLFIIGRCPIELELTDPDGQLINKTVTQISNASYIETDIDSEGSLDAAFSILNCKEGIYRINVIPKEDSSINDTYSIDIFGLKNRLSLADNNFISKIPKMPYSFEVTKDKMIIKPLSVGKISSADSAIPGALVNFTINITNTGTKPLRDIRVIDRLPEGLSYVSDNRSGWVSEGNITWNHFSTLNVGESIFIKLVAGVDTTASGNLSNLVEVIGIWGTEKQEEVCNSAYSIVIILKPKIKVEKTLGFIEPVQFGQYCESQKVVGKGIVDASTIMVDKTLALEYSNSMAGDGDIEIESENALSESAGKLQRPIGNNTTSLNLYENTKMTYSGETPLSGRKYLESKEFFGGIGASIQEAFSVNEMEMDQQTFFASTDPTSNEVDQNKIDQLRNVSSTHLVALETKNTLNGTWGTDAFWHKIFYKDINAHEMFTGTFEADKLIKFHESPVPEKEHNAREGIDC